MWNAGKHLGHWGSLGTGAWWVYEGKELNFDGLWSVPKKRGPRVVLKMSFSGLTLESGSQQLGHFKPPQFFKFKGIQVKNLYILTCHHVWNTLLLSLINIVPLPPKYCPNLFGTTSDVEAQSHPCWKKQSEVGVGIHWAGIQMVPVLGEEGNWVVRGVELLVS